MRRIKLAVFIIAGLDVIFNLPAVLAQDVGPASSYLCEYAIKLYQEGRVDDAVDQFKKALLANPNNATANTFLQKILSRQNIKHPEPSRRQRDEKVELLNKQLAELWQEAQSYQKRIDAAKSDSLAKETELQKTNKQFQSEKDRFTAELAQKQKALESLKSDYENRLNGFKEELSQKDSVIAELKSERKSILEEDRRFKGAQLAKIDELIKSIEGILSNSQNALPAQEDKAFREQILAKIEELIDSIKEVLFEPTTAQGSFQD